MSKFQKKADAVIIGLGGITGASVAHHLIERGWDNIIGIDKSGIPTDIGSTGHASDFCFNTMHDQMTIFTTKYSIDFFEKRGRYSRIGGLEVARKDDDERMLELQRRVSSGRAFGSRVEMISAAEAKERMPLLKEDIIQGALWDPDAGLVIPRSQVVTGEIIQDAEATGKLEVIPNNSCTGLDIENGRIKGVETERGYIETSHVVVCAGLWGRLIAEMVGEDLPVMPVDHPLTFFGPYNEFEGTGKDIGYPLLRDQGNSAYLRDTGDPLTSEGGQIEWGYYEETEPRMVHPRDLLEKEQARLSPSQRDLDIEQVMEPLERAMELTPVLAELGYNEKHSFNGLLQVTADGGPSIGESPDVRGLWYGVSVWVKDGPGTGKVIADWMTDGRTEFDHNSIDYARYYPIQKSETFIHDRCYETAFKIYNPPVHNREPYSKGRNLRSAPSYIREKELGAYFMEISGWERAHGYASNEATLLEKYADRVPVRENEWDNRHFWRVSNAEHLELSENVGMINLSHFAIYDVSGRDAETLMEYVSSSKVAGDTPVGKGVYTNFLDSWGGVQADLTVLRLGEDRFRVIDGADAGNRDSTYLRRMTQDKEWTVHIEDRTDHFGCIGIWGRNARENLKKLADNPAGLDMENFPFAACKDFTLRGVPVKGFRISYVGEQGWELHFPLSYGLALWDMFRDVGITPVGIETYANSRRLEKSLRLQNADLLTEYNLVEAGLARPKVKAADFHGKEAYLKIRNREHQPATLCTMIVTDNIDQDGVARYMLGNCPIIDPATNEVLVDSQRRRSYTTSIAFGPTIGKNIALAYLPHEYCEEGRKLEIEYFNQKFPIEVAAVGNKALYDPANERMKT